MQGITPTTKISSGFFAISLSQYFLIVEQIIAVGDLAVDIYGIISGYLVSTRLIQPGQHDVKMGPFLFALALSTSFASSMVQTSAPH